MRDNSRYAMLLSSLPYHGPLFGARQTPLSAIRLQQRLALLEPDDHRSIVLMRELVEWNDRWDSDAEIVGQARARLQQIPSAFVRDLVEWRLELRSVIAALRYRRRGGSPPGGRRWGYGRWTDTIARHWNEPHLGLATVFPWLPEASSRLEQGDALGLERLLLEVVWTHLERVADGHYLDGEAVAIYVQRWDLIARWTRNDRQEAMRCFDVVVQRASQVEPLPGIAGAGAGS
jgi:hypothetical protein